MVGWWEFRIGIHLTSNLELSQLIGCSFGTLPTSSPRSTPTGGIPPARLRLRRAAWRPPGMTTTTCSRIAYIKGLPGSLRAALFFRIFIGQSRFFARPMASRTSVIVCSAMARARRSPSYSISQMSSGRWFSSARRARNGSR